MIEWEDEKRKFYICKELELFFTKDLPDIADMGKTHEMRCFHCGGRIRLPIMAREGDVKLFKKLIELAEKYLRDKGVTYRMLMEIKKKCIAEHNRRIQGN